MELDAVGDAGSPKGVRGGRGGSSAGCIHSYGVVRRICTPEYGRENHSRKTRSRLGVELRVLGQQLTAECQQNNHAELPAKTCNTHLATSWRDAPIAFGCGRTAVVSATLRAQTADQQQS